MGISRLIQKQVRRQATISGRLSPHCCRPDLVALRFVAMSDAGLVQAVDMRKQLRFNATSVVPEVVYSNSMFRKSLPDWTACLPWIVLFQACVW